MNKKIIGSVANVLILAPLVLTVATSPVSANITDDSPENGFTRVNIHKLVYKDGETPAFPEITPTSDGQDYDIPSSVMDKFNYLAGAGFTVFDVSSYYYGLREGCTDNGQPNTGVDNDDNHPLSALDGGLKAGEGISAAAAYAQTVAYFQKFPASLIANYYEQVDAGNDRGDLVSELTGSKTGVQNGTINGDSGTGLARLELPTKSEGHEGEGHEGAVYAIYETTSPEGMAITSAVPTIIALPITKDNGTVMHKIYIYPKNQKAQLYKTLRAISNGYTYTGEPQDEPINEVKKVSVGDTLTYTIDFPIPADIADSKYASGLNVWDDIPYGFVYMESQVSNGLTPTINDGKYKDYAFTTDITADNGHFKDAEDVQWHFSQSALLSFAGQSVTITLQVKGNTTMQLDTPLENIAYYKADTTQLTDNTTKVATGAYQFIKIDGDSLTPLTGAKFNIYNSAGEKLSFRNDGEGVYIYAPETAIDADNYTPIDRETDIEVDFDGLLIIKGLASGTYKYAEIVAPDGYVNPLETFASGHEFVITTAGVDAGITKFNSTLANSNVAGDLLGEEEGDFHHDILNYHKGTLPSTGGKGIVIMLAVGITGMAFVAFLWKRNNKDGDETEA
ncbi:LPXTG-motif cell wall anchor domain-containing protein/fimbrial isopeptide formation D2 domain-containing protein [Pilibacter termitis]|uniref:LPXTG-motif cell wall anchor domain-containing protein/fimbrial isopeptide formation D2 domain-containing protein n=1 Tax=Pilibacter termitis TaxID=263852 RepID=A0A1T4KBS4_9ENTE|nr:SpaH/EbpB family LPXTG-anchored major pilin [Pilibacter termitis]SJZ39852.1 LPXTG-motif cell wall anchor domain-containing protein/fimbrial isopeptide formation D2 domain-containing protein [Pilibacter termitis]